MRPVKVQTTTKRGTQRWVPRLIRFQRAVKAPPRAPLTRLRHQSTVARTAPRRTVVRPAAVRLRSSRMRVVARVRPMSTKVYAKQARTLVARMRGADRVSAVKLLASSRVRRSPEAQHAVLAYFRLRAMKGGAGLPLSVSTMKAMVGSKAWNTRRMANFALVLRQASAIARREKIGVRQAFDKALKINGIYKAYYNGRCPV